MEPGRLQSTPILPAMLPTPVVKTPPQQTSAAPASTPPAPTDSTLAGLETPKNATFDPGQFSFPAPPSGPSAAKQSDTELLNSLQQILNVLQQYNPPPQSVMSDLLGNLKELTTTLADKLGLASQSATPTAPQPTTAPGTAEPSAAAPQPPTAPGAAEPSAAAPQSPTAPGAAEPSAAAPQPSETAPGAAAEASDSAQSVASAATPESSAEAEANRPETPTEKLKETLDKLLEMFRNRRLRQDLSTFSEEKLQERVRAALQELKQAQ